MRVVNSAAYPTLYADAYNEEIDCGGSPHRQCIVCGAEKGKACRREVQRIRMDNALWQLRKATATEAEKKARHEESLIREESRRMNSPEIYYQEPSENFQTELPILSLIQKRLDTFYGFIKYVFK